MLAERSSMHEASIIGKLNVGVVVCWQIEAAMASRSVQANQMEAARAPRAAKSRQPGRPGDQMLAERSSMHEASIIEKLNVGAVVCRQIEAARASRSVQANQMEAARAPRSAQGNQIEAARASRSVQVSQIEAARAPRSAQGSQIVAARASRSAQGSQIEPTRAARSDQGSQSEPARAPRSGQSNQIEPSRAPRSERRRPKSTTESLPGAHESILWKSSWRLHKTMVFRCLAGRARALRQPDPASQGEPGRSQQPDRASQGEPGRFEPARASQGVQGGQVEHPSS